METPISGLKSSHFYARAHELTHASAKSSSPPIALADRTGLVSAPALKTNAVGQVVSLIWTAAPELRQSRQGGAAALPGSITAVSLDKNWQTGRGKVTDQK